MVLNGKRHDRDPEPPRTEWQCLPACRVWNGTGTIRQRLADMPEGERVSGNHVVYANQLDLHDNPGQVFALFALWTRSLTSPLLWRSGLRRRTPPRPSMTGGASQTAPHASTGTAATAATDGPGPDPTTLQRCARLLPKRRAINANQVQHHSGLGRR